jgi:FKBP-type peptidyl-prolyl cis-trans isomerase
MAFMALLFLGSASALTIAVVWDNYKNRQTDNGAATQQADTSNNKEGTLQGTKLENFTPQTEAYSELKYIDLKAGTGDAVKAGDTITVDYTGALAADGVIFQSSLDTGQPISFSLNGVIKGWQEGIPGMKVGGVRRLLIPAQLAYGAQAQQGIPANSDLVFDVTLHKIGQ